MSRVKQPIDVQMHLERRLQSQDLNDVSRRLSRFDSSDQSIFAMIAKVARPLSASLIRSNNVEK